MLAAMRDARDFYASQPSAAGAEAACKEHKLAFESGLGEELVFRQLASAWVDSHHEAAHMLGGIVAMEVLLLSSLWAATGSLAAPAAAAVCLRGINYVLARDVQRRMTVQLTRGADSV